MCSARTSARPSRTALRIRSKTRFHQCFNRCYEPCELVGLRVVPARPLPLSIRKKGVTVTEFPIFAAAKSVVTVSLVFNLESFWAGVPYGRPSHRRRQPPVFVSVRPRGRRIDFDYLLLHSRGSARRPPAPIESYAKGAADCRSLSILYLEQAADAEVEVAKLSPGSEQWNEQIANVAYYRRMAENASRIANSNAEMVRRLKGIGQ